jgi:hypothetical protein
VRDAIRQEVLAYLEGELACVDANASS